MGPIPHIGAVSRNQLIHTSSYTYRRLAQK